MKSKNLLVLSAVVTAFFAANLYAGFDSTLNPFQPGVVNVSVEEVVGNVTYKFDGTVEYLVYAPGDYSGPAGMPADEYVYTYKVSNTSSPASAVAIDQFSMGLVPGSGVDYQQAAYDAQAGQVIPITGYGNSQTVYYMYIMDTIAPGESSALMLFSSPNAPVDGFGNLTIGTVGSVKLKLPTPVPEPVSLILLGAGCLPLRYYRKRARKAA